MSFSSRIKDELARIDEPTTENAIIELAGLVRMCARLQFRSGFQLSLTFFTENAAVARRIFSHIRRFYTENVEVSAGKSRRKKNATLYRLHVPDGDTVRLLLDDISFLKDENVFSPNYSVGPPLVTDRKDKRAYLRGSFLGAGYVADPEKSYHLELVTERKDHGEDLVRILSSLGFEPGITGRKEQTVVYLKGADPISDLLGFMGASNGVLYYEDVRALKDVRNRVNRRVNAETANLGKTVDAAFRQLNAIEKIKKTVGLKALPERLYYPALLRLQHPDAGLKDIGEMMDPPLGKSGIYHRFRQIEEFAETLDRR